MRAAAATTIAVAMFAAIHAADAREPKCRACRFIPEPDILGTLPPLPEPVPVVPFGDEPDGDVPFGWTPHEEGPPAARRGPYTQGFVLTYRVRHEDRPAPAGTLSRYADVGRALAGCWSASEATRADWDEVTLRVSFRRDGSLNGVPRIQHLAAAGDARMQDDLRRTFLSTLQGCAPLSFSPSLGAAVAGQIFAIRFIRERSTS